MEQLMLISKKKNLKSQIKLHYNLSKLLKNLDNQFCGDCHSMGPRWASCTLGIFLCVRCAGIHRNMGAHISRIKSVDHDIWTPQQVSIMKKIGNSRGRAIYEATLEDNFNRPQTDSTDEFIRSKYEFKRYIAKENISPNVEMRKLKQNQNDEIFNWSTGDYERIPLTRLENIVIPESDMNDTTDIGDFVSANQKSRPKFQISGSATEPSKVSPSWNSGTIANDTREIFNSPALSVVDREAYRNNSMYSDYQSREYALNRNNDSVSGQMNANDTVDVQSHQLIINSGITGNPILQPIIPIVQQFDIVTNNNNNNDDDDDDDDDDFGNIASANKRSLSNCQTSGSATEPFIVSPLRNSSTIANDTREIFNSPALSDVDREAYRDNSMHSDYQSREYALNRNNDSVPGQMNANDTVDVQLHHLTNISRITDYLILQLVISILRPVIHILQLVISIFQPVIHILQLVISIFQLLQFDLLQFVYYILTNSHLPAISVSVENEILIIQHHEDNHMYNDLQDHSFNESSENPDSDFLVAIPETQYEFAIAYEETGTDNYPNREMSQLFTMLLE